MTRLTDAVDALGPEAETALGGRWVMLAGERGTVHVVETESGSRYLTWCDVADGRAVEAYREPREAIRAGLRRAHHRGPPPGGSDYLPDRPGPVRETPPGHEMNPGAT